MELITVSNLTMQFGEHRALDEVDFTVHSGVTGLVGANGAGKTTFMSIALGLRAPTTGSIRVLDLEPVADGAKLRSLVSYGPERNILPDEMPAVDFVKHLAEVRGIPRKEAKTRASDILWLVGLGEERFRPIGTMSTGQRQRVKLAQAIAADPKLVFLDEPTDGLDPNQKFQVRELIKKMAADKAVIVSTHILEEVEAVCTRAVIIAKGQVLIDETPNELLARSPNQNSLKIEVDKKFANSICADVGEIDDVKSTEVLKDFDGKTVIRVFPKDNLNIAINVGAMLKSKGHSIINFSTDKGALDEVFRIVTEDMHKGKDQNA